MDLADKIFRMNRKDAKLFTLLLLILSLSLLFLVARKGTKDQASTHSASAITDKEGRLIQKINQELKASQIKSEINQLESADGNANGPPIDASLDWAPTLNNSPNQPENTNPLSFEQENFGQQVLKDTEYKADNSKNLTPEQRVNSKLERERWVRDYENREREVVVKQFIENAKSSGLDVRLNKNLEVTEVTPLQKEEPILFPTGGSPKEFTDDPED